MPVLHAHDGQEFNYVVEGQMTFYIGDISYVLDEETVSTSIRGFPCHEGKQRYHLCKFLAVVMKKEK
jgi:uncharacterized cupin superfamily protein